MSKLRPVKNEIACKISIITLVLLSALIFSTLIHSTVRAAGEDEETTTEFRVPENQTTENSPYEVDETGFVDYSGDIDTITGKPVVDDNNTTQRSGMIVMKDGSTYDSDNGRFIYNVEGGSIICSACDGMVVTGPVSIAREGEFNAAIYRDGYKVDGFPETVEQPGTYVVIAWDNVSENQVLVFQIVDKVTGRLSQYIVPLGFVVRTVNLDGVPQQNSFGSVDMSKEGYYEITYRCSATGIEYYLNVTTDHTPPDVTFEGIDSKGLAKGPVTIKGLADDDTVYIVFNEDSTGKLDYQNQITQSGDYHVTVMDKAGNSVSRDFIIMMYLNVKGVFFLALIVVIIIGVMVALYISRKRLRVR